MKREYFISVAIATYNGEKYIKEQLDSILVQLNDNDEIIISDDGSTDNTIKIINDLNDKRIKIFNGPKQGVKQNFANAIKNCSGKYVFLADQDDIWEMEKVKKVLETFEQEKYTCVIHDCTVFENSSKNIIYNSFYEFRNSGKGIIKNIWKNTYIGCCMAIDSKIIDKILPIPNDIEMHDQWIGILSDIYGKNFFIKDKLIRYRRHENNVSKLTKNNLNKLIKNRSILILRLVGKLWKKN